MSQFETPSERARRLQQERAIREVQSPAKYLLTTQKKRPWKAVDEMTVVVISSSFAYSFKTIAVCMQMLGKVPIVPFYPSEQWLPGWISVTHRHVRLHGVEAIAAGNCKHLIRVVPREVAAYTVCDRVIERYGSTQSRKIVTWADAGFAFLGGAAGGATASFVTVPLSFSFPQAALLKLQPGTADKHIASLWLNETTKVYQSAEFRHRLISSTLTRSIHFGMFHLFRSCVKDWDRLKRRVFRYEFAFNFAFAYVATALSAPFFNPRSLLHVFQMKLSRPVCQDYYTSTLRPALGLRGFFAAWMLALTEQVRAKYVYVMAEAESPII
jgi:hypothetical protein